MSFSDDDLARLKKLLKTPVEDTQFYQEYPDRCKTYAKALKALVFRLEAAEWAIAATVGEFEDSPSVQAWRKSKGA